MGNKLTFVVNEQPQHKIVNVKLHGVKLSWKINIETNQVTAVTVEKEKVDRLQ